MEEIERERENKREIGLQGRLLDGVLIETEKDLMLLRHPVAGVINKPAPRP